jgi:hypothetical protein
MKIRILRQTSIYGQPARVGDVIEAFDSDGRTLVAMGKAEQVQDACPMPVTLDEPAPAEAPKPRTRKPRFI